MDAVRHLYAIVERDLLSWTFKSHLSKICQCKMCHAEMVPFSGANIDNHEELHTTCCLMIWTILKEPSRTKNQDKAANHRSAQFNGKGKSW